MNEVLNNLLIQKKDAFGGQLQILNFGLVKGRNLLIRNGYVGQPNSLYMKKDNLYWHYNKLLGYWLSDTHKKTGVING